MTKSLKWWLLVAFVVVFLAGGALGLFAGAVHARHHFSHGRGGMMGERMRRHLQQELKLTPEQAEKVGPIMDRASAQLEAIRKETGERVGKTMAESHREIVPLLTPEQRERLDQMHERHLRIMHRREGGRPDGPNE